MTDATLSRRHFLGAAAGGLAMPALVTARVDGDRPLGGEAAERSCIFVWLCGGPSHLDTWDLKPDAPAEIRGPYKPAATKVPGLRINELASRLATMTDDFSVIRSMTHVGNISNLS